VGLLEKLAKVARSPRQYSWVFETAVARVRGELYRHAYRVLSGGRVQIGRGFIAECPLHVRGPGRVVIGDGCRIRRSNLQDVSIVTLAPEAEVSIGERSTMGGLRVRCASRVAVGKLLLAAKTTITDTDAGVLGGVRGAGRPVEIGNDCWLGVETTVLGGVKMGNNVVVSGGSVVTRDMPDGAMAMGNPARPMLMTANAAAQGGAR